MARKKARSYYQRTGINNYKVISCRIKDENLEALLNSSIKKTYVVDEGKTVNPWNPQEVIRLALYKIGAVRKDAVSMGGDTSMWRPGESIKTSFYKADAEQAREFAAEHNMTVQQLIISALYELFIEQTPTAA